MRNQSTIMRTTSVSLTNAAAAVPSPSTMSVLEAEMISATAWSYSDASSGTFVPVLADTPKRFPLAIAKGSDTTGRQIIYAKTASTATLYVTWFGDNDVV